MQHAFGYLSIGGLIVVNSNPIVICRLILLCILNLCVMTGEDAVQYV